MHNPENNFIGSKRRFYEIYKVTTIENNNISLSVLLKQSIENHESKTGSRLLWVMLPCIWVYIMAEQVRRRRGVFRLPSDADMRIVLVL